MNTRGTRRGWLLLGALLVLLAASAHGGTIVGTAHDSSRYFITNQVCIMCHAPHNTRTDGPLWNHATTVATFTLYASPTMDATVGQPGGVSKLCLSCHDGTLGISDYAGSSVGSGGRKFRPGDKGYIGTALGDDHPIGIPYDTALATSDGELADPATKTVTIGSSSSKSGTIAAILLTEGRLECPSCHDVHNRYTVGAKLVKVGMTGSSLCYTCHIK